MCNCLVIICRHAGAIIDSLILMASITISFSGDTLHLDSRVVDCVLPAAGRNHPAHVVGGTAAWQISSFHDDFSVTIGLDNCLCFECAL